MVVYESDSEFSDLSWCIVGKIIATRTEGETKPFSRSVTLINFKSFKAPDQDKISEYFKVFKKLYLPRFWIKGKCYFRDLQFDFIPPKN